MRETGIEIIYDGACPFCSSYVRIVRLREVAGRVDLIDARSDDPRVAALMDAGFDLEAGMAVRWRGNTFHGAEAMHLIAELSTSDGVRNNVQRLVMRRRPASVLYPLFVAIRRLTLRLLGRQKLNTAKRADRNRG